ncbi:MAG: histidinol-phosphate transaminase [Chitinispirillaceae bacterium]|nr:histidinol-phosphate transaminase [Chitinispirillaceae bacterium]
MEINEVISLIKPSVRKLKAYHLEKQDAPVKLNQNENPYDCPLDIKKIIADFCISRPWNRYPPFIPTDLKKLLGEYTGTSSESIIVGNGSNEMLLVFLIAIAQKDIPIIICQPTFTVYSLLAEGMGLNTELIYLDKSLHFDINAIIDAIKKQPTSPLIICSPNNPTGTTLSEEEIREILRFHKGFLLLDQAYIEFGGFNAIPLLSEYPNLIITRTFSKAFAGAGLRLGYMVGNPEIIKEINKIKLPYNINFFSEYVARTLLTNRDKLKLTIQIIIEEREKLLSSLKELPITVYPTSANFILIRVENSQRLFDYLYTKGILLRDVSNYPMLENCLRITVGKPEENQILIKSMIDYFK